MIKRAILAWERITPDQNFPHLNAGMSTLPPEKKRPADGSPNVSPDADQLALRSPPKKPTAKSEGVKLAREVIDLTGYDLEDETSGTGVVRNLAESFEIRELGPLVQGAPYDRKIEEIRDQRPWEEDVKPLPVEGAIVLRTAGEVSQKFATIVHDVELQQKAEALRFLQRYNEDQLRLLDAQESRMVAVADALLTAVTVNESRRQDEFLAARESLQNRYLLELESYRCAMQRDAEIEVRDEVQSRMDECQGRWDKWFREYQESQEGTVKLRRYNGTVVLAVQDDAYRSACIRQERVEVLERQHRDDVQALQAQTSQEQQSLLTEYSKREVLRAAENTELVKKKDLELKALRQEVMRHESQLEKAKSTTLEWRKLAEERDRVCPNCVWLEQDVLNLTAQLERSTAARAEAESSRQREVESLKIECHGLTKALAESQDVVRELEMELDSLSEAAPSGNDLAEIQDAKAQLSSAQVALEVERVALAKSVRTLRLDKGVLEASKKLFREQEAKGETDRRSQEQALVELRSELEKTQARQRAERRELEELRARTNRTSPLMTYPSLDPKLAQYGITLATPPVSFATPVGTPIYDTNPAFSSVGMSKCSHPVISVPKDDGPTPAPGHKRLNRDLHDTVVYGAEIPAPPVPFSPPLRSNPAEDVWEARWPVATVGGMGETLLPIAVETEVLEEETFPEGPSNDPPRGGGYGNEPPPYFPATPHGVGADRNLNRLAFADARKYAPKLDCVDRDEYDITDAQVVRIFDDRLTSCGVRLVQDCEAFRHEFIAKTLNRKVADITDYSKRRPSETYYADQYLDLTEEIIDYVSSQGVTLAVAACEACRLNPGTNRWELLVRWKGHEAIEFSWEPLQVMYREVPLLVRQFIEDLEDAGQRKKLTEAVALL
ncbi:hypothetical protein H310_07671 [Aphanomyces invadans]|uniref:Chromo domain-containing protein n=1 Tax=Aphanomyces invadans TaxID=157072 RepID=A0A024U3U7_9STRA|nr:hypothetical protein H310_07671 [Aphanomyces invadans]ETW00298.1 hypothetical protein H310_07671 [Aphanomyces invadans]|eukprot:XP_008871323.1 hypothetical protein H310_07671 [Aphanomyces invadans]